MATAAQKTEYLELARNHLAADMLIKGVYGDEDSDTFRGCSVGCFVHDIIPELSGKEVNALPNLHKIVSDHFGPPEWLLHLQDAIFEGLPMPEHQGWHVQIAEALARLPDNHDWQRAHHRVHAAILCVAIKSAGKAAKVVQRVIDLHDRASRGEDVREFAWSAARSAAWSAAWSAARSAAESAAWSAAWSAARSAAESAAWSAARSAAWSAAWSAAFEEIRDAVLSALPEPIAA